MSKNIEPVPAAPNEAQVDPFTSLIEDTAIDVSKTNLPNYGDIWHRRDNSFNAPLHHILSLLEKVEDLDSIDADVIQVKENLRSLISHPRFLNSPIEDNSISSFFLIRRLPEYMSSPDNNAFLDSLLFAVACRTRTKADRMDHLKDLGNFCIRHNRADLLYGALKGMIYSEWNDEFVTKFATVYGQLSNEETVQEQARTYVETTGEEFEKGASDFNTRIYKFQNLAYEFYSEEADRFSFWRFSGGELAEAVLNSLKQESWELVKNGIYKVAERENGMREIAQIIEVLSLVKDPSIISYVNREKLLSLIVTISISRPISIELYRNQRNLLSNLVQILGPLSHNELILESYWKIQARTEILKIVPLFGNAQKQRGTEAELATIKTLTSQLLIISLQYNMLEIIALGDLSDHILFYLGWEDAAPEDFDSIHIDLLIGCMNDYRTDRNREEELVDPTMKIDEFIYLPISPIDSEELETKFQTALKFASQLPTSEQQSTAVFRIKARRRVWAISKILSQAINTNINSGNHYQDLSKVTHLLKELSQEGFISFSSLGVLAKQLAYYFPDMVWEEVNIVDLRQSILRLLQKNTVDLLSALPYNMPDAKSANAKHSRFFGFGSQRKFDGWCFTKMMTYAPEDNSYSILFFGNVGDKVDISSQSYSLALVVDANGARIRPNKEISKSGAVSNGVNPSKFRPNIESLIKAFTLDGYIEEENLDNRPSLADALRDALIAYDSIQES